VEKHSKLWKLITDVVNKAKVKNITISFVDDNGNESESIDELDYVRFIHIITPELMKDVDNSIYISTDWEKYYQMFNGEIDPIYRDKGQRWALNQETGTPYV